MEESLKKFGHKLLESGIRVGTVEQYTSGLLGATISSMCGLSTVYKGSIIVCDKERIINVLGIPSSSIDGNNIGTAHVVYQMALCGLKILDVDLCISVVSYASMIWLCCAKSNSDGHIDFKYEKLTQLSTRGKSIERVIIRALNVAYNQICE